MGNGYSNRTNLGHNCTSLEAGETGTIARWGDTLEVSMGNWKEGQTESWGVEYKTGKKLEHICSLILKKKHDYHGLHNIYFGLEDTANNKTSFRMDITMVGLCDGLRGGIKGIDSSGICRSFTSTKQGYTIETTIVSYDCSYRDGLFVLQMKKKKGSDVAHMVIMAHYYVTKVVGLSVAVKICPSKGQGFVVEVKGPFKHPSADLRRVMVETCKTGVWSPGAKSNNTNLGDFNSSLKSEGHMVGQIVKNGSNKGLINSSGCTKGSLNNSVFVGCKF